MTEKTQGAAPDGGTVTEQRSEADINAAKAEAVTVERKRVADINAVGAKFIGRGLEQGDITKAINDGLSVDAARATFLDKLADADDAPGETRARLSVNQDEQDTRRALAALYAASEAPEQTAGLCLVNSAGNFEEGAKPGPEKKTLAQQAVGQTADVIRDPTDETAPPRTLAESAREAFGRLVATGIFYFTKVRIKSILSQVYEFEVDDDLVRSIELAAEDPGAIGTFYQLSLAGGRTKRAAGDLLEKYEGPLMLLWGERDPWMTPSKAERIMEMKPEARYVPVVAGHCPHDDAPVECSEALANWADEIAQRRA